MPGLRRLDLGTRVFQSPGGPAGRVSPLARPQISNDDNGGVMKYQDHDCTTTRTRTLPPGRLPNDDDVDDYHHGGDKPSNEPTDTAKVQSQHRNDNDPGPGETTAPPRQQQLTHDNGGYARVEAADFIRHDEDCDYGDVASKPQTTTSSPHHTTSPHRRSHYSAVTDDLNDDRSATTTTMIPVFPYYLAADATLCCIVGRCEGILVHYECCPGYLARASSQGTNKNLPVITGHDQLSTVRPNFALRLDR
ncbi:hypothetical protein BDZ89DRAFT_1051996 [Hymenopellis radicata]|nr:hypothetical protein BDZ89DRAFT_1051996 [Hymenopellis radicata]